MRAEILHLIPWVRLFLNPRGVMLLQTCAEAGCSFPECCPSRVIRGPGLIHSIFMHGFLIVQCTFRLFATTTRPLPNYWLARRVSKCFSMTIFESNNLFTQLAMQPSSLPANFPEDIEPGMHFLKHISVNSWISTNRTSKQNPNAGSKL